MSSASAVSFLKGISVVMATYNGECFVRQQLESIAGQTLKPLEIVVGDDGSGDRTVDIIQEFAKSTDIPVRLEVNETRLGHSQNFLRTANRAVGELTALSDQDDVWHPRKLEKASVGLAPPEISVWVHGWRIVDEDLNPLPDRRLHTGFAERSLLAYPLHVPHGSRLVFRTALLRHLPPDGAMNSVCGDGGVHHDEWVMFAGHVLGTIALDRTALMLYRRHPGAVSADAPAVPSRHYLLSSEGEPPADAVVVAAAQRAAYLRRRALAPECAGIRSQLLRSADYYDRLVPRLARREKSRCAPSRLEHLARLAASLLHGDYGRLAKGNLGLWALTQDTYALLHRQ